jgi:hypothetical protein
MAGVGEGAEGVGFEGLLGCRWTAVDSIDEMDLMTGPTLCMLSMCSWQIGKRS